MGDGLEYEDADIYRAVFDSIDEACLLVDVKGRVIDANEKLKGILGYERQQLIGCTTLSLARLLTKRGLTALLRNPFKRVMNSDAAGRKVNVFKKNGELISLEINSRPLVKGSTAVGQLLILNHASSQKEAETVKDQSQEVYRSLVDHIGIGIFRTTPGIDGMFLEVNPVMEEITGYSREELLSMHVSSLYVHPEERAVAVKEVISGMLSEPREVRFKKKDGTEIVVRDKKVAVSANDGKSLYLEGFLEDITERKRVEESLALSEKRYRLLAENMADVVWTVNVYSPERLTYVSQSITRVLGYSVYEAMGRTMQDAFTPESFQLATSVFAEEMVNEIKGQKPPSQSRTVELVLIHKDGSSVPLEVKFNFIRGPDGRPVEILAVARDIGSPKQAA